MEDLLGFRNELRGVSLRVFRCLEFYVLELGMCLRVWYRVWVFIESSLILVKLYR